MKISVKRIVDWLTAREYRTETREKRVPVGPASAFRQGMEVTTETEEVLIEGYDAKRRAFMAVRIMMVVTAFVTMIEIVRVFVEGFAAPQINLIGSDAVMLAPVEDWLAGLSLTGLCVIGFVYLMTSPLVRERMGASFAESIGVVMGAASVAIPGYFLSWVSESVAQAIWRGLLFGALAVAFPLVARKMTRWTSPAAWALYVLTGAALGDWMVVSLKAGTAAGATLGATMFIAGFLVLLAQHSIRSRKRA